MSASTMAAIGVLAEDRWGMFTAAQASGVGVSAPQLSRLVSAGALERMTQGVYRVVGAPTGEHDMLRATWLALGGHLKAEDGAPRVVAAGTTAAELHGVGDFYLDLYDFVVPRRRGTRMRGVRLRVRELTRSEITHVDGMAAMTVERMIADLVELNQELSLVGDLIAEAHGKGLIASVSGLSSYLQPLARRNRAASGEQLRKRLFEEAGIDDK
ncbi:type IV toxin-antitoxin system AbiEi family antitoxin domain-containing protein [Nesterenkonia sandarakina]|uniref:Putative transcriptional regulator of viral defense system n=1 Tax=Nesterenkonia sandarakina TaxID=272918 RepID=A0A7Z0EAN0_9MICC|nr:type IV toxin-antitoxin system AbiEi family antitoxin domain-containing protein [Nesterenkonia sandarakina]NYJ18105.1 putative transcriptional regulator of viral defense system [Nesterenkonia sandarakina]